MTARERYEKCKKESICYYCGATTDGKTRCDWCREKLNKSQRERDRRMRENSDYAEAKRRYIKKWMSENPDRVEVYKARKYEANRRYSNG